MATDPKQTISQLLAAKAREFGPRTFVLWRDSEITYAELDAAANRIANLLIALGVAKGTKVALLMDNCILHVALFLGITRAGAVLVPINPRYSAEEMTRVVDHSDATVLIFAADYWPRVQQACREGVKLKRLIADTEIPGSDATALEGLMAEAAATVSAVSVDPHDLATIIYTSGTTGIPKGVMLSHWNYVVNALQANRCKKMRPQDRFLTALPLCHVAPQVGAVLAHLCAGGSVVLLEKFSPREFLDAVETYEATAFGAVPTIYSIFLNLAGQKTYDFSALRYCNTSAAPMPLELGRRVQNEFKASLMESYGLTEGTCGSACNPIDGVRKPGSVGLPLEGQELRIVDGEGNQLGPGETGELLIRGENLMQGYYKDPRATAEVLRDGWLYTGDLAYLDEDGYLFLVGRKKELIIRGGANIYPADVEAVLYRHPQIQEAVVVGLPDDVWGECVHACIIPKPGADLNDEEIIALCREALTDYKVPESVSRHQDFPRTSTNKVKRRVLVDELTGKKPQR